MTYAYTKALMDVNDLIEYLDDLKVGLVILMIIKHSHLYTLIVSFKGYKPDYFLSDIQ